MPIIHNFGDFSEGLQHFHNRFFLVILIRPEAYAIMCTIEDEVGGRYVVLFPSSGSLEKGRPLPRRVGSEEVADEFCQRFGVYGGVTSQDETIHKHLNA